MNIPLVLDAEPVSYIIGNDALEKSANKFNKYKRIIVITDENVEKFCLHVFKQKLPLINIDGVITIKSGEEHKTINQLTYIWNELTRLNADRDDLIVNLGGGVVTDIGGMAAATFKRGLVFINYPTTLLGMVDAAIGGKTGIDFEGFKNQVGLFVAPKCVIIDPVFLHTLEDVQWQSGFAEVLKYGLIMDKELWQKLEGIKYNEVVDWNMVIIKAARDKIDIVRCDILEKGIRKNLNFGHTVGHSLESFYLKSANPVTHGMAIAAGMICESWLSSKIFNIECTKLNTIVDMIDKNFNRFDFTTDDIPGIMQLMRQDKKVRENKHNFSLLRKLGKAVHEIEVDDKLIIQSLEFYVNRKSCD
ncbi:MAG: 3-dehydroquinate synthase [Bacteroidetes bacterium]|nr:3-dehydroquinate synthase [Bacteroidota bacterium]MBL6943797.1 3-dehydroquinate synthase [Bacteroidales bacterium]